MAANPNTVSTASATSIVKKARNDMDTTNIFLPDTWGTLAKWSQYAAWAFGIATIGSAVLSYWAKENVSEIQKQRASQRISIEADAKLLQAIINPYAGKKYWIIVETNDYDKESEQMIFSSRLAAIFDASGWNKEQQPTTNSAPLPLYQRVTSRGVSIGYSEGSPDDKVIAEKVSSTLKKIAGISRTQPFSDIKPGHFLFSVGLP